MQPECFTDERRARRYGRTMVAVSFVVFAIVRGDQAISGILIQPLRELFHVSTAAVLSSTTGSLGLMVGLLSPLCGLLLQHLSIRTVLSIAVAAVALGYCALAYASQLWHVVIVYGVLFAGAVAATSLAVNALITNWFAQHRGLAMGIASAGSSLVAAIAPPAAAASIASAGFTPTMLGFGIGAFLIVPLVSALVIDRPEQRSLRRPDGPSAQDDSTMDRSLQTGSARLTVAQTLRSTRFWSITGITGATAAVGSALTNNLVPLAQSLGVDRQAAAYLVSSLAVGTAAGMIAFGKLLDVLSQRAAVRLLIACLALPCLLFARESSYFVMVIGAALLGLGAGATAVVPFFLCSAHFGAGGFAAACATMMPFLCLLIVAAVSVCGYTYDIYATYDYALSGALLVLAADFLATVLLPGGADPRLANSRHSAEGGIT